MQQTYRVPIDRPMRGVCSPSGGSDLCCNIEGRGAAPAMDTNAATAVKAESAESLIMNKMVGAGRIEA